MHISPFGTVRVILIIQMIFSIFINQSVSIVHPTIEGSMVVNRTKLIRIGCIECIGQPDFFPAKCIFWLITDMHGGCFGIGRQRKRDKIIDFILCQTDIHISIGSVSCVQANLAFRTFFLYRKQQIAGRVCNMDHSQAITFLFQGECTFGYIAIGQSTGNCQRKRSTFT